MKNVLNITNGDSAVEIMKQEKISGDFLPWRDVLHDGPVPSDLSIDELSQVRAKFISDIGWGTFDAVSASFIERDNLLKSLCDAETNNYEKVILWFEHDLYDQLQIIQILDWFNTECTTLKTASFELSIICIDQYLGLISTNEMKELYQYEKTITDEYLELSTTAWSAFRADNPEDWRALLDIDTSVLPFLEGAVIRQLEEYPECSNGLSRTEQQILKIVSEGESKPLKIFKKSQEKESRIFMGDSSFWKIIERLLLQTSPSFETSKPLLELTGGAQWTSPPKPEHELKITSFGKAVLSGDKNWLELSDFDHWIGGVHLSTNHLWCWHADSQTIVRRAKL